MMSSVRSEAEAVDRAVYAAVVAGETPRLDVAMRRLSRAADYSRISLTAAALLTFAGGERGRRAALTGLAALGMTSAAVNVVVKPLTRRRRPERPVTTGPQVRMPRSRSFPSGHTACAVAFASGAGRAVPAVSVPLHAVAALVGYSRVHTGVHYPGDVVAGAVIGAVIADATESVLARLGD
jgi:undecaprenyl-diphosphatase